MLIDEKIMKSYWDGTLKITNKPLMYALMRKYLLGNSFRIFDTEEDLEASNVGVCGVRSVGRPGLPCIPWISPDIAFATARNIKAIHGCEAFVVECDKYLDRSIQGELQISNGELCFYYTFEKSYMRQALKDSSYTALGLKADLLLKRYLNEVSYEDVRILLDKFPDHVLELTVYNECVGYFPGRNYVSWEIRLY